MFRSVLGSRAGAGQQGEGSAQGGEPEGGGYRIRMRLFGVGRIAVVGIGAVLGVEYRQALG